MPHTACPECETGCDECDQTGHVCSFCGDSAAFCDGETCRMAERMRDGFTGWRFAPPEPQRPGKRPVGERFPLKGRVDQTRRHHADIPATIPPGNYVFLKLPTQTPNGATT